MALIEKLSAIGDAIRERTGGTELLTLDDMPIEIAAIKGGSDPVIQELSITSNGTYKTYDGVDGFAPIVVNVPQDGAPTAEELTVTGECQYRFAYDGWNWVIEKYGHMITTKDLYTPVCMFNFSQNLKEIPFEINFKKNFWNPFSLERMFGTCKKLQNLPKVNNVSNIKDMRQIFNQCQELISFPDDYFDDWDFSSIDALTSAYSGDMGGMIRECSHLRKFPTKLFMHGNPVASASCSVYQYLIYSCACLDEVVDLPNPHYNATFSDVASDYSGLFVSALTQAYRLKRFTFAEMGPVKWARQILDFSKQTGWTNNGAYNICGREGDTREGIITADKEVKDDATYQALKNDPDWFTQNVAYSRYNHDSAVETINSLPDCSAYQTSSGYAANTIKFMGAAGSATDGGAINTLTEDEIAVAAAKGWTVTLV